MMIKFKIFKFKKVLNIFQVAGDEIIHPNNIEAFPDKPIAKMGP